MSTVAHRSLYAFAVESDPSFFGEAMPFFKEHWAEVEGEGEHGLELDIDLDRYKGALKAGGLRIYTVRRKGELAGYSMCWVVPALRYRRFLMASTDAVWLTHPARRAGVFQSFLRFIESDLRGRGVWMFFFGYQSKHNSVARLLQRSGYRESHVAMTKCLQEARNVP